jgi:uncharacterized protein (TIGR02996 family)
MSEHDHFRQLLGNNPDDDLACLVYADWLEERGQSGMAEYLRLECRLRQLPADHVELLDLLCRRNELCQILPPSWLAQYRRYTDIDFWDWPRMYQYTQRISPTVCTLSRCRNTQAVQRHIARTRQKALYRTLEIVVTPATRSLQRLQQIPELGDFDILIVNLLTDDSRRVRPVLEALTHFPAPVRWKTLFLNCDYLTTEMVDLLQEAPAWQGLRHLHVRVFQASGLEEPQLWSRLYQARWFSQLRGLRMQLPSPQAYESLVTRGPWQHCQWLEWDLLDHLAHMEAVNVSLAQLSQAFPNLRGLRIGGDLADMRGKRQTLNDWPHLRFLDRRSGMSGDAILDEWLDQPVCTQLWELRLSLPPDSHRRLVQFLSHMRWPALQGLSLWGSVISVRLLHAIRAHPDLQKIRYLFLGPWISDTVSRPIQTYLRHCSLPQLLHLSLGGLRVHPAKIKAAVQRYLPQLRLLNLECCQLLGKRPRRNQFPHLAQSHPLILWPD